MTAVAVAGTLMLAAIGPLSLEARAPDGGTVWIDPAVCAGRSCDLPTNWRSLPGKGLELPDGGIPVLTLCEFAGRTEIHPGNGWLCVGAKSARFQALASEAPPSRTRLSFDSTNGDHVEILWEPFESARLSKAVTLGQGAWQVSVWTQPVRDAFAQAIDYAWKVADVRRATGQSLVLDVKSATGVPAGDGGVLYADRAATISLWPAQTLTLTEAAEAVGAREGGVLGGPPATGRAFGDVAEKQAEELLNIVAEIVLERAREKGFDLLSMKVRAVLCDELALTGDSGLRLVGSAERRALFPNTCELVRGVRLQDVASAGAPLLHALVEDMMRLATEIALANLNSSHLDQHTRRLLTETMAELGTAATRAAIGAEGGELDPQLLLTRLARQPWLSIPVSTGGERDVACGVQSAFAVIAACHASTCDARAVRDYLEQINRYFDTQGCDVERARKAWPSMERFIAGALKLLSPSPGQTYPQQIKQLMEMVFDLAEHFELARDLAKDPLDRIRRTTATRNRNGTIDLSGGSVGLLESLRGVFLGALDGDVQPALSSFTAIMVSATEEDDPARGAMVRAAQVGGAMASYLSHPSSLNAADAQVSRQARKQAIESLIDATTSRTGRTGDWIISLSGSLRVIGGVGGEPGQGAPLFRWSLPLGISVEYIGRGSGGGFYAELSPLDLGRYVDIQAGKLQQPHPFDALGAYVSAGYQFGGTLPVIAGATAAFKPGLAADSNGVQVPTTWEAGAFVGIQVPIFDFN